MNSDYQKCAGKTTTVGFLEFGSWCTYANSLSGRHEEVIVYPCQLEGEREQSWLDRVKNRFVGEKNTDPAIDVGRRIVQGPSRKVTNRRIAERIVYEILENKLGLALSFPQRFDLFMALLNACCQNTPVTLASIPQELTNSDTVKKVELLLVEVAHSKDGRGSL